MPYESEREVFERLKTGFDASPAVQDEFLGAVRLLIYEYNTTVWENRFIVGGAVVHMLAAAMRAIGIGNVVTRGQDLRAKDITVGDAYLSVNTSFTGRRDAIRLVNT